MKKRILVLLVICASFSAFAMEASKLFDLLPAELTTQIIAIGVQQANTIKEAIDAIKDQSLVNKIFRQIIKDNAAQLINYLAKKHKTSPYDIAFKLGALSEQWFQKQGLLIEAEKFDEKKIRALFADWQKLNTKLIHTVKDREEKYITDLLQEGAEPNFQDAKGISAFVWAVLRGKPLSSLKILLDNGADINLQDFEGNTALMYAIGRFDSQPIPASRQIKFLLKHGADLTIKNKENKAVLKAALDMAKERGYPEIEKILQEAIK